MCGINTILKKYLCAIYTYPLDALHYFLVVFNVIELFFSLAVSWCCPLIFLGELVPEAFGIQFRGQIMAAVSRVWLCGVAVADAVSG